MRTLSIRLQEYDPETGQIHTAERCLSWLEYQRLSIAFRSQITQQMIADLDHALNEEIKKSQKVVDSPPESVSS